MSLFTAPPPALDDLPVIEELHTARVELSSYLRTPRRWLGTLRRNNVARAIRGSNSIEGYNVDLDDAVAAVEDEAPLSADAATWAEIKGYRLALGYVLGTADDPSARIDESTIRTLHYMMLSHDLSKSPGRYREREIFVQDEATEEIVYTGPDAELVPGLMTQLVESLVVPQTGDPFIDAAMAHLNLVMIHPFRDGNGRMARCLQTLMLGRGGVTEPLFSSIEEWLGSNTEDYYHALAVVGRGAWHPELSTDTWIRFCLRAHHMQSQTQQRRIQLATRLGTEASELIAKYKLPERTFDAIYDAMVGLKVRRQRYVESAQIDGRTGTRDLLDLSRVGLLTAQGQSRGRFYAAGAEVVASRHRARQGLPHMQDPYPGFIARLRAESEDLSHASSASHGPRLMTRSLQAKE